MKPSTPVTYDARSFRIRGKRELLISGEIHYARSPRELWPALLDRSVACGLNGIASYIFWNFHEPQRDVYDFSGRRDLGHFLALCAERNLHVILRAGPYCCAEWNYGGYPPYLRDEPGITIRTANAAYQQRVEKYFAHLIAEIRPYLATRGGPVILVQVENEYANVAKRYGVDGERYLAWMAELTRNLGVDVPLIMCEGGAAGVIDTVNGFSIPADRAEAFRRQHPDMPMIWTELWPGWYDTWGFQHHLRSPHNIAYHLLSFLSRGGAGWNYYMWHGGTNFDRSSMYLQTTRYDLDCPLDEYGRPTVKATYLAELHALLRANARLLLEGERQSAGAETTWTLGKRSLVLRTDEAAQSARLLDGNGAVLFDTGAAFARAKKSFRPQPWRALPPLRDWRCWHEPFPGERQEEMLQATDPIEQLRLTGDASDYCWYSTTLAVSRTGEQTLEIPGGGDFFYLYLDGKLVAQSQPPFRENRGPTVPDDGAMFANDLEKQTRDGFRHTFRFAAARGKRRLDILAVSLGLIKGDWQISGPMNTERKGIWLSVLHNGRQLSGWEMRPFLAGELHPGAVAWQKRPKAVGPARPCTWYATVLRIAAEQLHRDADFRLDATGLGKGAIFLNGHELGRYWLIAGNGYGADESWQGLALNGLTLAPAGEPTQRYYHIPRAWLREVNRLVLFEEQPCSPDQVRIEVRHGK